MAKTTIPHFEIAPHDAGVSIKAWGKTVKELFLSALQGAAHYLNPTAIVSSSGAKEIRQKFSAEAVDVNSLLVEFLTQVISYSDSHNAVFTDAQFGKFGEDFLEAELLGIEVAGFEREIKSVGYEDVEIKKDPKTGRFEAILMLET